jgi:hypothetical protein
MTTLERLDAQIARLLAKLPGADDDTYCALIVKLDKLRTRRYRAKERGR